LLLFLTRVFVHYSFVLLDMVINFGVEPPVHIAMEFLHTFWFELVLNEVLRIELIVL